jgi:hypothetical protein
VIFQVKCYILFIFYGLFHIYQNEFDLHSPGNLFRLLLHFELLAFLVSVSYRQGVMKTVICSLCKL